MKVALLIPGYLDSPDYQHLLIFEKRLKELGYTVERIDPCDLWKTGNIENYTLTNCLKQIKDRISYYQDQKSEEIILIGHSMGAFTAIVGGVENDGVSKIIALCPPPTRKLSASKWINREPRLSKRDLPEDPNQFREFVVPYSYVEDALQYSAVESAKKIDKSFMLFIAMEDKAVPPEETEKIAVAAKNPYVVRQPNMGHDFRNSKEESEIVMDKIEEFLSKAGNQE